MSIYLKTGKVLPEAEPIYTNGVWDQSKITEPNINSRGRKTNVTIAGLQSETGVFPPSTAESTIYTGVVNQQLKDSTKNHANAVGDPVPSYTTISEYSTEIQREIARLEAELAQETNNKDRNSLTKKIRSLQEKLDSEKSLHILFNPPYGERLPIDVDVFYRRIGDKLKQSYSGSQAWFITANMEALKFVGLRPSRRIKLFNGKLESKLVKYELYTGTKKIHKIMSEK